MTKQGSGNVKTPLTEGGESVIRHQDLFAFADFIIFPSSVGLMESALPHRHSQIDKAARVEKIKRQIFEKVRWRMIELGLEKVDSLPAVKHKESPDVIVISDDRSLLFEPQNLPVTEWLHRHFNVENLGIRDRLRVHPSQCQETVRELKAAGFEVAW